MKSDFRQICTRVFQKYGFTFAEIATAIEKTHKNDKYNKPISFLSFLKDRFRFLLLMLNKGSQIHYFVKSHCCQLLLKYPNY